MLRRNAGFNFTWPNSGAVDSSDHSPEVEYCSFQFGPSFMDPRRLNRVDDIKQRDGMRRKEMKSIVTTSK